jgi:hypothetical protein
MDVSQDHKVSLEGTHYRQKIEKIIIDGLYRQNSFVLRSVSSYDY